MPNYTSNNSGYGMKNAPWETSSNGEVPQQEHNFGQYTQGNVMYGQPVYAQAPIRNGVPVYQPPATSVAKSIPKKKRGAAFYIAIVVALLALIAASVLAYMWWDSTHPKGRDSNAIIGQIEGKSEAEIQEELDRIIEEGMFQISIASEVEFENGTSEGALQIENVPANHYLMQVDITRTDTGELLYQSGILEPNYHIQNAPLLVDLPAGTYECNAMFHALDPETEDEIGQAAANIVIKVLS